ncbi:conserved hypothetical fusion protein [Rhizobium leguminosarum bv. trifolii WSM2304]|uniref:Conserved hypothetical fusion protein n=1 Tax=Rhizobium leguminosarum bv. trifolii (strain WSM2304) TaxID=395492 RepID=A0ABF7QN57_RHILW|nr:hypothetical protein [Rhizobium leguminosarum]ACI55683.1 conserved hypothetical fusion protein [Rhizobium leguminosarum bv. trifolii WSM2304]
MPESALVIWADGPSSSPYEPDKALIRAWGYWVESTIGALSSGATISFLSLAALNADLNHPAYTLAWVNGDPVAENNGIYRKLGASGTGSWTRFADLPYSFIAATATADGEPSAIEAVTGIPVSSSAMIVLDILEENDASPVTVSFNGGDPLTIKSNTGNDIATGGLLAGMRVLGTIIGNTFRLITDQVDAAIVAEAEAAMTAAIAARNGAKEWANNNFGVPVSVPAGGDGSTTFSAKHWAEVALEGGTILRGYLFGGEISNNATDLTNDLDIAAGVAASDDTTPILMVWAAVTRQLDVAYGSGNGGRFDSAIADGVWHIFACSNGSATIIGMSQSVVPTSAPNYPSGYTKYRRIGSRNRISGAWRRVIQRGDRHMLLDPLPQNGGAAIGTTTTAALLGLTGIPTGIEVEALFEASFTSATVTSGALLSSPLINDAAVGASNAGTNVGHIQVASQYTAGSLRVRTNTSGQIRHRAAAAGNLYLAVHGWFDDRGAAVFKSASAAASGRGIGSAVLSADYPTLQDAITAAAGKRLIVEAGSYVVSSSLTGVDNIEIESNGPVTISTTADIAILDMTSKTNWMLRGMFRFVGDATPYTGYPGSLADSGQKGIKLSACDRYMIDGMIEFENINGSGLYAELSAGGWQHKGMIRGLRAKSCYHGIRYTNVAEYDEVSDFSIDNCAFAVRVESGNVMFVNGKMNFNSVCVSVQAGSNDAHGEFANCQMNHSEYAVDCLGLTFGEVFTGCIALGNQAGSGHGKIRIDNSVGVQWNGGQIGCDISLLNTSKVAIMNAYMRSGLMSAPSVSGASIFTAKNNVVDTGGLWTYNN